jgi:tetratricopeptide (TPR) repeat protein
MIEIAPENPWGHFYLGVCYFEEDDLEKARDEFEKVRELSPAIEVNLYNLALTYQVLGEFELAIAVLKDIIEFRSEARLAHYYLGICYELNGDDEPAKTHYENYLSILNSMELESPDDPGILIDKGRVLTRLGRKEEGMEIGRRGFELDSSYHYNFAQLLAVQQYPEQALHHLENAFVNGSRNLFLIKIDPDLSSLKDNEHFLRLMEHYIY